MISTRKRNQAQRTTNEKYVLGDLVLEDWILVREDDFLLGV